MEFESVKKSGARKILLTVLGVLIVVFLVVGVYYKLKVAGDPVILTNTALESLSESIEDSENYSNIAKFLADNDEFELTLTGDVTLPMNYGKLGIDLLFQEDSDARDAIMDLELKLNDKKALYLEGELNRNALYFAFDSSESKYYYLSDLVYPEEMEELDLDSLIDKFKSSFRENVKSTDFQESTAKFNVNSKKIDAKKYSLKLTNDLTVKILDSFFTKIEKDVELMKDFVELSKTTDAELKSSFDEIINSVKTSEEGNVFYNIYVYKNTAVRFEITDDISSIIIDDYEKKEIKVKGIDDFGDEVLITLTENKDGWDILIDATDVSLSGFIKEEEYNITLKTSDVTLKLNGTQSYNNQFNALAVALKGNIQIEQEGATISIPYDFDLMLKEIENIKKKDTSNKIDINNMSEEESAEFNKELLEIPLISSLVEIGNSYNGTYTDDNFGY